MAVTATAVETRTRTYPHVDRLDPESQQVARILYDQIFTLQERLTAAEGTITNLLAAVNTLQGESVQIDRKAEGGLGPTQL